MGPELQIQVLPKPPGAIAVRTNTTTWCGFGPLYSGPKLCAMPNISYCINPTGTSITIGSILVAPDVTTNTSVPALGSWVLDHNNYFERALMAVSDRIERMVKESGAKIKHALISTREATDAALRADEQYHNAAKKATTVTHWLKGTELSGSNVPWGRIWVAMSQGIWGLSIVSFVVVICMYRRLNRLIKDVHHGVTFANLTHSLANGGLTGV